MTMDDYADGIIKSHPGRNEAFWAGVPLIGKPIACALYRKRLRPFIRGISQILRQRNETEVSVGWQSSGCNHALALHLLETTRADIGWATPRFMPDDPLWVIYWAHLDCQDYEDALSTIETTFGFTFTDSELTELENHRFGAFVTLVESRAKAETGVQAQAQASSSGTGSGVK